RNPEDAWLFTQRLCGVCTYVHGVCSVRSVEDALGITVPDNARLVRNLLMGAQYVHDHIVHFYQLHALDWVDVVSALEANLDDTARLAKAISPEAAPIDFAGVKARLNAFVGSGKLGPFAGGYWGHPAYKLFPEENLLLVAHYLAALRQQVETARMHAILGAKNPHLQTLRVGGVTCKDDLVPERLAEFRNILARSQKFVDTVYMPDVVLVASRYPEWFTFGKTKNFLTYGEFPLENGNPENLLFPQGSILGNGSCMPLDTGLVAEHVKHSWYKDSRPLHPSVGKTVPFYTRLDTDGKYSWLKAPRYKDEAVEVGPLARMLVAVGSGRHLATTAVNGLLAATGGGIQDLQSTLGRTAARAMETQIIAQDMSGWLAELESNLGSGVTDIRDESWSMDSQASGMGLNEAPRGALGHWISINDQKIENYQMVVPSTWNFGPRCAKDVPGPVETALIGTPVVDPAKPVEILRTIHSFDPCVACAVHVVDVKKDRTHIVKVL
ncbi:MAG: nickel-dependent hydrogenase large subunit, partial [Syntrophobacteraceae bacterium]|nr:nickel-dependent hydrogenase large subunit [Syntrophobacteraceae bacterium]